jgi:hypothetical protein
LQKISRIKITPEDIDFISELSETLGDIMSFFNIILEEALSKAKNEKDKEFVKSKVQSLKKSLYNLDDYLSNTALGVLSEGHKDPNNKIASHIKTLKESFDVFAHSFQRFAENYQVIVGSLALEEVLQQIISTS